MNLKPFALLFLFLAGCTLPAPYTPPHIDMPCQWSSDLEDGMRDEQNQCFNWWEALNDPLLNRLMDEAAAQNKDLAIAGTRLLEARVALKGKAYRYLPHVDGSFMVGHLNLHNNKALCDLVAPCSPCRKKSRALNLNFFELGFDVDWEIDLFGTGQFEKRAAEARLDASNDQFEGVFVTLSAEIARHYVELRGAQLRLDLIEQTMAAQKELLGLTKDLVKAGDSDAIAASQVEEQYWTLAAEQPLLELAIQKTKHRLSILLGLNPGELACELSLPGFLPALPYDKPIGIPSDLLRRRPDVRAAERTLAAAYEEIGSAEAEFLPRFSLKGFVGDVTTRSQDLFNPAKSGLWWAGPQVLAPLFNSHLIKQHVELNKIQARRALFTYQKTVLEALEEAENALAAFHAEMERGRYLQQAIGSAKKTHALTYDLYHQGFKSYSDTLLSQRNLFNAQSASIQAEVNSLVHFIILYKALGGGGGLRCQADCYSP
ncbi:MAG: efflux transporter outer membrane subunit [Parachlamydia sp.]|nr:efflux transporter outer membrane subunit [Parachlamydia sp.]